jgi:hypothetical protein
MQPGPAAVQGGPNPEDFGVPNNRSGIYGYTLVATLAGGETATIDPEVEVNDGGGPGGKKAAKRGAKKAAKGKAKKKK